MILLIDNYDSFTYNLADLVARHTQVCVMPNDAGEWKQQIKDKDIRGLLLSPGPGRPADSGISRQVVWEFWGKVPILGVCLGHQLLVEMTGGRIVHALAPMHGKTSKINHSQKDLFKGIPLEHITVMRYHSLVAEASSLPPEWEIAATTTQNEIMAIHHRLLHIYGVQFHPESILTEQGDLMLKNWLAICGRGEAFRVW